MEPTSTKPYFVRALHEWCTDNGLTPYIAVQVDDSTQVPREFVRAGEIVLNISSLATNRLQITNECVQFQARFGGVARDVYVPMGNISAIYAKETGHGMSFEVSKPLALEPELEGATASLNDQPPSLSVVSALSAEHNGGLDQTNAFADTVEQKLDDSKSTQGAPESTPPPAPRPRGGKPRLTVVK